MNLTDLYRKKDSQKEDWPGIGAEKWGRNGLIDLGQGRETRDRRAFRPLKLALRPLKKRPY